MSRSRHPIAAFVLALLLISMQQAAQLHALEHIEEALKHAAHQSYSSPEDEVCAICALFAGGANAIADEIDLGTAVFVSDRHLSYAPPLTARPAPRFYDSRAPPAFL